MLWVSSVTSAEMCSYSLLSYHIKPYKGDLWSVSALKLDWRLFILHALLSYTRGTREEIDFDFFIDHGLWLFRGSRKPFCALDITKTRFMIKSKSSFSCMERSMTVKLYANSCNITHRLGHDSGRTYTSHNNISIDAVSRIDPCKLEDVYVSKLASLFPMPLFVDGAKTRGSRCFIPA